MVILSPNILFDSPISNCFRWIAFEGLFNRLYLYDDKQKLNRIIYLNRMKKSSYNRFLKLIFLFFLLLSCGNTFSQEVQKIQENQGVKIDSLYREDQFYFGITYNFFKDTPEGFSKSKFSTGFTAGFLRDMPINKWRTIAVASGVGLTYNNYNENIGITGSGQNLEYKILDTDFNKNKITQLLVDVPVEFRWRTSTYESYQFWRIYGGLKFSYLLYDKSIYTDATNKVLITNNKDFNPFLYGVYVSAGYNTFNMYAYYGLNSLFKSAAIDGEKLAMKSVNIGVIFYIL